MGNGYPSNPSDLNRSSGNGKQFIFNTEDDTWKNHGSTQKYPLVDKDNDGLVSPSLYNKLVKIKESFEDYPPSNLKLTPNKTYFYNFISTDRFIDFKIENNHLRIEANKGLINRRLAGFPCRSPRGRDGMKGPKGRDGTSISNEKFRQTYQDGTFEIDVNIPLENQPISLRGFDQSKQIFEAIINLNGSVEDEDDSVSDIQLIDDQIGKVTITGRLNNPKLRFKIRQIGPQGETGPDGVNYVQVKVEDAPTNGQFTEVIGMLWYNASINSFITKRSSINELLNNVINVTPRTDLPTNDMWAAVEIASKPRKAVEYHQFLPSLSQPKINLPNYTPLSGCYNQNRYSLGYLQPDDNVPFTIIGDPLPSYTNCKEPFWFCGNTGDTCDDLIDIDPKELNPLFDTSSSSGTSSSISITSELDSSDSDSIGDSSDSDSIGDSSSNSDEDNQSTQSEDSPSTPSIQSEDSQSIQSTISEDSPSTASENSTSTQSTASEGSSHSSESLSTVTSESDQSSATSEEESVSSESSEIDPCMCGTGDITVSGGDDDCVVNETGNGGSGGFGFFEWWLATDEHSAPIRIVSLDCETGAIGYANSEFQCIDGNNNFREGAYSGTAIITGCDDCGNIQFTATLTPLYTGGDCETCPDTIMISSVPC